MTGWFTMRSTCATCGSPRGQIENRNGQDCVYCEGCGKWQYNAPRTETGKAQRSVETVRNGIKPKRRARILMRDGNACALCHRSDVILHVEHLLAVDVGLEQGLTDAEINCDENLCTLCEECNLGIGKQPFPLRLAIAILKTWTRKGTVPNAGVDE